LIRLLAGRSSYCGDSMRCDVMQGKSGRDETTQGKTSSWILASADNRMGRVNRKDLFVLSAIGGLGKESVGQWVRYCIYF